EDRDRSPMNREQKAVAIEEIAAHIDESHAIFAVDYRGISVPQVAELRAKLRDADATFTVVKNSLTERAADQAGAETLKDYLAGPTALTFVRGDAATAAKAIADYARITQLLPFKGGLMDGDSLDIEQLRSLSRLPSREVLYGQLVGVVASPVGGLVRTLSALVGGLASALGQVRDKKESGEIPAGDPPAAAEAPAADRPEAEAETPPADAETPAADDPAADQAQAATETDAPQGDAAAEEPARDEPAAEAAAETEAAPEANPDDKTEPASEPAQENDNQADASAEAEQDPADAKSTKED
ncbi:MAG TPA: 50S ribosomal protein L10, partial [Solirubrobacteraceae bacterium]